MRILITNNTLAARAGTELYVRDIALRLKAMGHFPVCYSQQCGDVARELRDGGVKVVSSLLDATGPFDVIHGHHCLETMLAAMTFPRVPAFSFCHGPLAWQESPAFLPNIVHYAAVDEACRQRLIREGVAAERITLLLNFADTRRFLPRAPLPATPGTALVFSNQAGSHSFLPVVQQACAEAGIKVDVAGLGSGCVADRPEELLPRYDLVFAKARCAIEAMAVGCAVILGEYFGGGWLVTPERFDTLRPLNFGYLSLTEPVTVEHFLAQIRSYDAEVAAAVSARVRAEASLEATLPALLDLYERVAATTVPAFDPVRAGLVHLERVTVDAKDARNRLPWFEQALKETRSALEETRSSLKSTREKVEKLKISKSSLEAKNGALKEVIRAAADKRRPWWKKLVSR